MAALPLLPDTPTTYALLAASLTITAAYLLFHPTPLVHWLQKKNYQYEVTTSLYMLTPTEKFVFNSIAFLTLSLLTLAVTLYLPDHLATISRRGYYYFVGGTPAISSASGSPFETAVTQAATTVTEAVSELYTAAVGNSGSG